MLDSLMTSPNDNTHPLQGLFNSRMARLRLDLVMSAFRAGAGDEAAAEALSLAAAKSIMATITMEQIRHIAPLWAQLQALFAARRQQLHSAIGGEHSVENVVALDRWTTETMAALWLFNEAAREALTPRQRAVIAAMHSHFPHDSARIVRNVHAFITAAPLEFRFVI